MGSHITGEYDWSGLHWRASCPLCCLSRAGRVQRCQQISLYARTPGKKGKNSPGFVRSLILQGKTPWCCPGKNPARHGQKGAKTLAGWIEKPVSRRQSTVPDDNRDRVSVLSLVFKVFPHRLQSPRGRRDSKPYLVCVDTRHGTGKKGQKPTGVDRAICERWRSTVPWRQWKRQLPHKWARETSCRLIYVV